MLKPTAIADETNYTANEIEGLFVRRFKKDIEAEVTGHFSERRTEIIKTAAFPPEEAFFLNAWPFLPYPAKRATR